MIQFSRTKITTSLLAIGLLFSFQEAQPTPTKKVLALLATYVAVHFYWKNVKAVDIIEDQTFLQSLINVKDFETAQYLVDRWIMGRPDKAEGLKVSGSEVSLQGRRSLLTPHIGGADAQELTLYTYKGAAAYGLFGTLNSYIKMIYKILKDLKDINDVTTYWNITEK